MKKFFLKSLIVFLFVVLSVLIIGKGFFVYEDNSVNVSSEWELLFDGSVEIFKTPFDAPYEVGLYDFSDTDYNVVYFAYLDGGVANSIILTNDGMEYFTLIGDFVVKDKIIIWTYCSFDIGDFLNVVVWGVSK